MRPLLIALSLTLCAGQAAAAAEAPFSRQAVLDTAAKGLVWCSNFDDKTGACEQVATLSPGAAGAIRQSGLMRLMADPDVQIAFTNPAVLEGDALCADMSFKAEEVVVLIGGQPATSDQAAPILDMMRALTAEFEGKRECETYVHDPATGLVRSVVKVDGAARPDLDDTYKLLPAGADYRLRPLISPADMERDLPA